MNVIVILFGVVLALILAPLVVKFLRDYKRYSGAERIPYIEANDRYLTKCAHTGKWIGSEACQKCRHHLGMDEIEVLCTQQADHAPCLLSSIKRVSSKTAIKSGHSTSTEQYLTLRRGSPRKP